MGVNYTAYVFLGAEVEPDHFFTKGKEARSCRRHGSQDKAYCGDCGNKTDIEYEMLWTPEMKRAAEQYGTTPEALWEEMGLGGDDALYFFSNRFEIGFWRFGYESEYMLFGTAIAKAADDDRPGGDKSMMDLDKLRSLITEVEGAFKVYGIELPVKLFSVQDCG